VGVVVAVAGGGGRLRMTTMYDVKDLKKGMVVYECYIGINTRLEILRDAYKTKGGWEALAKKDDGRATLLFASGAASGNAARTVFYAEPQYVNEKHKETK
jgi:hypothetical protein